jgi:ferric-dicitrate binding protein FerR (iron transport regulator)
MRVFHYNHTPIRQVLTELSETYGVELEVNDTTQCVTGEFEVSSVEEVISLLENAIPVTITKR